MSDERTERNLESAILATLIERHPNLVGEAELIRQMTMVVDTPERVEGVERAVRELVAVGLLERRDDLLEPTPASLRVGELELGF